MRTQLVPFQGGLTAVFSSGPQSLEDDKAFLAELEKFGLPTPAERDLAPKTVIGSVIIPLDHFVAARAMMDEVAQRGSGNQHEDPDSAKEPRTDAVWVEPGDPYPSFEEIP